MQPSTSNGNFTGLLRGCELLEPEYLVMLLKAIRNLSMIPSLLDGLQNANIIEVLVTILSKQTSGPYSTVSEPCNLPSKN
jgi:hypothetical protein